MCIAKCMFNLLYEFNHIIEHFYSITYYVIQIITQLNKLLANCVLYAINHFIMSNIDIFINLIATACLLFSCM